MERKPGHEGWKTFLLTAALVGALPVSCVYRGYRAAAPFHRLGGHVLATGDGMGALVGPAGLVAVDLSGTAIGDEELVGLVEPMKDLPNLRTLNLRGTRVTNDTLVRLRALGQVSRLDVTDTRVTAEGVRELKRARPQWDVRSDADVPARSGSIE